MAETQTIEELQETARRIPDRIIDAAARVMERDGYDGSSLRDIAAEAGVSKPGLYYHSPSKDFLLFAIHDRFATQLVERAETVYASELSAEAKLRELIRLQIGTVWRFKAEGTVFMREYWHLTGELRETIDEQRDRHREIFEEVLRDGQAADEFRAGDAAIDALVILGACNFSVIWVDPEGPLGEAEIAEAFADRLINGLKQQTRDSTSSTKEKRKR